MQCQKAFHSTSYVSNTVQYNQILFKCFPYAPSFGHKRQIQFELVCLPLLFFLLSFVVRLRVSELPLRPDSVCLAKRKPTQSIECHQEAISGRNAELSKKRYCEML
jgi:hypothetical protein